MKPLALALALSISVPPPALAVPQGSAPPLALGVPGGAAAYNDPRLKAAPPQYLSYTAFGTSLTAGCCASSPARTFVALIGAQLGVVPTNAGISGSEMADQQPGIYARAVGDAASQLFTLDVGKNEGAFYGAAPNRVATFQAMHQASLAWLATPARNRVAGQSVAVTVGVSAMAFTGPATAYSSATVATAAPHGFATGQPVTVAGAAPSAYDVTAPVTVVDATHFTIPMNGSPPPASPAAGAITATGPGIAYAGAWNADVSLYGGALSMHSSANGATATFTAYGPTLYLAYGMATNNGGTASVAVDGSPSAALATGGISGGFATTSLGVAHGSGLLRITGLSAAQHTVVVAVTSATGGGDVWVDWVSGKGSPGASAYPGGPTAVAMGSPQGGNGAYADAAYVAAASQDVGVLAGDGLNVLYADVPGNIDPGTDILPDNVHFNDLGEAHAAEAVMSALNTAATGRGKSAFLAAANNPFPGPILSGAAYGNAIAGSGPGGNAILGGGYGAANRMNGSGNNNAIAAGSSNSIGQGGPNNTNNNFLGGGTQNVIQFGGLNFLGSGSLNAVQGFNNALCGGAFNQVFGQVSAVCGGSYAADRSRYGWQGWGSGSFTSAPGTAQAGAQLLRGAGSSAASIRLTADGAAAGGANTVNLPASASAYGLRIALTALDVTAPANTFSWSASAAVLSKTGPANATTALAMPAPGAAGGPVGVATNGWAPTVTAAADASTGGLSLTFTPPPGNTDTVHVVARVDSVEVQ